MQPGFRNARHAGGGTAAGTGAEDAAGGPPLRTLDWESAGDNDPLFDLVGLCVGLGWGIREAQTCHAAYRRDGARIEATEATNLKQR